MNWLKGNALGGETELLSVHSLSLPIWAFLSSILILVRF